MNVCFIHRGGPDFASYRYRVAIPAEQLKDRFDVHINGGPADIVVFSKPQEKDIEIAKQVKDGGGKVVSDIGDDHFNHPTLGPVYREIMGLSDHVVTASNEMAKRIFGVTDNLPSVIDDPYEMDEHPPHAKGERALWFGHNVNLKDLNPSLLNAMTNWDFNIVTGPRTPPSDFPVIRWSLDVIKRELLEANIVILPTRKGAEYKSPNRLINLIRMGCFPVCSDHPAYKPFRHVVWVGQIYTGLRWVKALQPDLNDLVKEAQGFIESRYSPKTIGDQWADLLESL